MITLQGKSVYSDVCMGKILFYSRKEQVIVRYHVDDTKAEVARFNAAKAEGIKQLKNLYDNIVGTVGEADAAVFEIHQMMMEDLDYCDSIENIITTQNVNAEYAVGTTADNFQAMFLAMDDDYMRGRAADVKDVSERLVSILQNENTSQDIADDDEMYIVAADDLAPSETVQLDKDRVLGFVLKLGSTNSHTAILARSMGIPAIIGLGEELKTEYDRKFAIVDGFTGTVYIDPDEETLALMKKKKEEADHYKELLLKLKGKENITKDGTKINIYANIGSPADVAKALANDAGGIGLFRSEFLYLENSDFPTEEQQFLAYKQVAENMAGKKVVIRTLDIGADKQAAYFNLDHEENPALGYRAIRICLTQPEIFKTQLRALYRAAVFGNISIMFPMITSVDEVIKAKKIAAEVREELEKEKIPYKKNVETGIMIETPAAALISDELAKLVDFFSVGTNDLTQYTLAIDRQNRKLEPFANTHHKAVLKLIEMAAKNAHKEGIWIGICGELGADTTLTEEFLRMGIDELSVSAGMILRVRNEVRNISLS
ncbi:MAG: phosphoenolpyruvate--protein phosphotransferase [Eubacteriales bacterium]|nr:phosphoenolpyruvate--protein phosphotransferase [Eubacteriales bacterium]